MDYLFPPICANAKGADRALYDYIEAAGRVSREKQDFALAKFLFYGAISERG
jgi:hypothetical protein